jgi:hypothetical protein
MGLWKGATGFFAQGKSDKNDDPQIPHSDPRQNQNDEEESVLLVTGPVRASFIYKYVIALFPVFLVIASIFTRMILDVVFHAGSSSLIAAVPGPMASYSTSLLNQYSAPITSATNITILMIAPVGIFILFAAVGWAMRITELWTGTALTLGLSSVTGIVLAGLAGPSAISGDYMLLVLQWIAYLVQPFCIIAAGIVIFATEKFRRSITYTIRKDGVGIRGGFWVMQEHMIPDHQIGRIVVEQDFIGRKYNFGTVIPQTITRWGAETSFRGVGASGQKDNFGVGIGYARGREEASRYPLDCLYGIHDPKNAQKILTELVHRRSMREEEQVSLLKKIYETGVAGIMGGGPGLQPPASPGVLGFDKKDDAGNVPAGGKTVDEKIPEFQESTIIRVNDDDIPAATIFSPDGYTREIPPFVKTRSDRKPTTPPVQPNPPPEPVLDQIRKLAELRDSGIITEQEFAAKKTELLKRI